MRHLFVWIHRYVGLAMALFLIIEGLTGSLLAFRGDLTRLFDPVLASAPPMPGAPKLDLATLIKRTEALEPRATLAGRMPFPGDTVILHMHTRTDPPTGRPYDLGLTSLYFYIALDPWTGKELKRLQQGMYTEGFLPNVMPVVYDLHKTLILGGTGVWILAIVALLWTIDCFVGFYLTLPLKFESFWRRWKPAWLIKWRGGFYRVNFDLHRAGGLWFWAMLFVFAWSSVELLDRTGAYHFVMGKLFDYQTQEEIESLAPSSSKTGPLELDLHAAQTAGDKLMAELAQREGFKIEKPFALYCNEDSRQCSYTVRTDRWFPNDQDATVNFDADTGAFRSTYQTNTGHAGDTVSNWLFALHLVQNPVDYLAYRIFVAVLGIVIVMLSVTGVYIWWKKRCARVKSRRVPAGASPARVSRSWRSVVSVAWSSATAAAKRTQQSRGVRH
ncbi:PepSY-associated TM helix domain-containing protein [Rhodoblastus sp.]|jgi:uncharacterized iron-regulated membrane protein|uniref:PepSY-associated TM helix domain-containing protein n=1 Tax=Rhodoblastus sp. TaxID=1962975 RepID=UPI003F9AA178